VGLEGTHPRPKIPVVAIVGMGPRGLYCLEALMAEFSAHPLRTGLHVAIFNKSSYFGVSPIYDLNQPPYLLSNIRAKELDLWDPDGSDPTKPTGPGFRHWYNTQCPSLAPIDPEEYPPRAAVGRYLFHGFQRAISRVPQGMRVSTFTAEVTDIVPGQAGYHLKSVDTDGRRDELLAHKVMLSTGHSFIRPTKRERYYHNFADRHPRASFIPYTYPVTEKLSCIPAGARVAMKGIGLTFIDAALALTEGRGGAFKRDAGGRLCYVASGREPKRIIPFGRSGLPMAPKPCDFPSVPRPLTFVTAARLNELQRQSRGGKLDLERDIWPFLELEMERRYYRTAMSNLQDGKELGECGDDARAMRQVIRKFIALHPDVEPFSYDRILDPIGRRTFTTGEEHHSFVERYLRQEIDYARDGLASSPARAAVSMWYEIRGALKPFVAHGGLTAHSHRLLIEYYFPLFKRVVFGPPIISIEKILALHRAGVLDFSVARNPRVVARHTAGCFELRVGSPAGVSAQAEILVDARYPTVEILRDVSPLYQSLSRRGMIREFKNTSPDATYATGAIDMSRESQYVIDRHGEVNADITVYGAPTEGNLIGNFVISRDSYASTWAANLLNNSVRRAE